MVSWLSLDTRHPQKLLYQPPPQLDREKKNVMKVLWIEIGQGDITRHHGLSPAGNKVPRSHALPPHLTSWWDWEENWKQLINLMDWDKDSSIEQHREKRNNNNNTDKRIYKESDTQCRFSLPGTWLSVCSCDSSSLHPAPPVMYCHMVWSIPLASPGQLSWLRLLPACCEN